MDNIVTSYHSRETAPQRALWSKVVNSNVAVWSRLGLESVLRGGHRSSVADVSFNDQGIRRSRASCWSGAASPCVQVNDRHRA
jgi:hypothetical protein